MRDLNYRPLGSSGPFPDWLNELRNQSGAYIIRSRAGRTLYVGESHTGALAKTIKRHFYSWQDDPERKHHTYERGAVEVAVRLCPPAAAPGAQDNLIRRLDPRDNALIPAEEPF